MELFWLEHKKLWRKKIVKICVLLCFVYCVIFGSILSFQWFGFGSSDDYTSAFGNNFDGYTVIKDSQEYALSFMVDRSAYDKIMQAGGYVSINTGGIPDANAIPIAKPIADEAMAVSYTHLDVYKRQPDRPL